MRLTVLSVAYPFAPITADPVGGAEQVLSLLDRALVAAGHRSVVLAAEGSAPAGELISIPRPEDEIDETARIRVYEVLRSRLRETIARERPDLVHLHGIDFDQYMPEDGARVLATLHLPLAWYPAQALAPTRPRTWLAPVSRDQSRRGPPSARLLDPVENGVDVDSFMPRRKHRFVLALGRICPEKGFHLALDAAKAAGVPLVLAGSVFPYAEHRRYFETEIQPRLDNRRRWIGPVSGAAKRRLMAAARCLVTTSLVPETSSLVAREALAAGTPVVALRNGALAEAVEHGRTGVLVDDPAALPRAIRQAEAITPSACRREARRRFPASRMVDAYFELYRRLGADAAPQPITKGGVG